MRRRTSGLLGVGVLLLVLAATAGGAWLRFEGRMQRPGATAGATRVAVPAGASLRGVLRRLESQGLLPWAPAVEAWLRLHRQSVHLAVGTYEFPAHASPADVLAQLASGRTVLEQLTIVEGWTFAEMRRALAAHPALAHDWSALAPAQLMERLGAAGLGAEGRFFPDTYRFAAGTSDRRIYQLAYARMNEELAAAWAGRDAALPVANEEEALVLASIIEKETGRADERGKVAAVFVNRLRKGMRLQSDPTVIYGLGAAYDGNIHLRDLQADTPYNTYTRAGLPPTPIALPGAAALQATLHPEHIDALFFVATGRGDGSHQFSATLAEHNAAVQAFLARMGQHR
ncbi:MAG: endolytic transglycosylase MltG [Steroidobacteraceae bacterium]